MPAAALPADADITALRFVAGSSSYARGVNYANGNRVMRTEWQADALELTGLVRGSGRVYQTRAAFRQVKGKLSFVDGECSCPMEFDCKHVVALVLTAASATPGATGGQPAPVAPSTPAWERSLQRVLDVPGASFGGHLGETPLALQLALQANDSRPPKLIAKIVRPGQTGWVNGNLSWSGLSTNYYGYEYQQAHVRLLQELFAVFQARTAYPSYFYSSQKSFELSSFESPNLWPLLDEARQAGLHVVHASKKRGDIDPYREAEFVLDVTRHDSGALTVRPVLRIDDVSEPVTPVTFIGTEAHGVVWATHADVNGSVGGGPIRLARLTRPVSQQLQELAIHGTQLDIPAEHAETFIERYYLRLRQAATVTSTNETFVAPTISGPGLLLTVSYGENHSVDLDLEWQYDIGDSTVRCDLHDHTDTPYRDFDHEREVLTNLSEPLALLGFSHDDHARLEDMPSHAHYAGIDTVRFTTEVLPLLDTHPDLGVEVQGERIEYREATDSVVIGVSADESADSDWFDLGVSITVDGHEVPLADVITAITRHDAYLLLADGTFFSLDKPELQALRRLLDEAQALHDAPTGDLRISRYQADLWSELSELGVVRRQADAWARQVDGLLASGSTEPAALPSTLHAQLRPYQRDGYEWLAFLWRHQLGGILADDMGLGKTLQTLALVCGAKQSTPDMAPVLIVAPTSVVPGWASEAARFAPGLRVTTVTETRKRRGTALSEHVADADVVVTSYTLFRIEYDDYADLAWSGLVLDEAQSVKNHKSKAYQAVRKLATPFKLAITGTPMENNLMELWSLLSIVAPGLFPSPAKFKEYYAKPIEKGRDTQLLGQLRRRIKPLVKRRTKEQVAADLPAKQEQVLEVELHPRHRTIYDRHLQRERQKILGLVDELDKNRFTILRSLTVLRQLSLHAGLVDDEREHTPSAKIDALLDHLQDVVGSGHRALIFSQFTGFLGMVRSALASAGVDYQYLDGATRGRGQVLDEFKNGAAPVFLISLKAGGFGLNLTEADYVFLLDPWWNPATEAQAVDRTHRIGQTRNVMVYRLIAKDTIEEKVMALKERKAKLFASVMDDGDAFGSKLTADDIRGLFD